MEAQMLERLEYQKKLQETFAQTMPERLNAYNYKQWYKYLMNYFEVMGPHVRISSHDPVLINLTLFTVEKDLLAKMPVTTDMSLDDVLKQLKNICDKTKRKRFFSLLVRSVRPQQTDNRVDSKSKKQL